MFNKTRFSVLTLSILAAGSVSAAADGVIDFKGTVTEQTCNVEINKNSGTVEVILPDVTIADLSSVGATAGETVFNFAVTDCKMTNNPVQATFLSTNIDADGNLANLSAAGYAGNVALQLLDKAKTPIKLEATAVNVDAFDNISVANNGDVNFYVQYISTAGGATAGLVTGSVQFGINYN